MRSLRFRGYRKEGVAQVVMDQVQDDGRNNAAISLDLTLPPRHDLSNHSPTGFEWGFVGSGPSQLALAILAAATENDTLALALHNSFTWQVVTKLPHEHWYLHQLDVLMWTIREVGRLMPVKDLLNKDDTVDLSPEAKPTPEE
jgi:hypothetical protein